MTGSLTLPAPPGDAAAIDARLHRYRASLARLASLDRQVQMDSTLGAEQWLGEAGFAFTGAATTMRRGVEQTRAAHLTAVRALEAYRVELLDGQRQARRVTDELRTTVERHNTACQAMVDSLVGRLRQISLGPADELIPEIVRTLTAWRGVAPGLVRSEPTEQEPILPAVQNVLIDLVALGGSLANLLRAVAEAAAGVVGVILATVAEAFATLVRDAMTWAEAAERALGDAVWQAQRRAVEIWQQVAREGRLAASALREVLAQLGVVPSAHPRPVDETPIKKITRDEVRASADVYDGPGITASADLVIEQTEHTDHVTDVAITFAAGAMVGLGLSKFLKLSVGGERSLTRTYTFATPEEANTFRTDVEALMKEVAATDSTSPEGLRCRQALADLLGSTHYVGSVNAVRAQGEGEAGIGVQGIEHADADAKVEAEASYDSRDGSVDLTRRVEGSFDLSGATAAALGAAGVGAAAAGLVPNTNAAVHLDGEASLTYHPRWLQAPTLELRLSGTATDALSAARPDLMTSTDGGRIDLTATVKLDTTQALAANARLEVALARYDAVAAAAAINDLIGLSDDTHVQQFSVHRESAGVDALVGGGSVSRTVYTATD